MSAPVAVSDRTFRQHVEAYLQREERRAARGLGRPADLACARSMVRDLDAGVWWNAFNGTLEYVDPSTGNRTDRAPLDLSAMTPAERLAVFADHYEATR